MILSVQTPPIGGEGYDILLERGLLHRASQALDFGGRALIVTDDGVPARYADALLAQLPTAERVILPHGEATKCPDCYLSLLRTLTQKGFTRRDCVIALGGGVMGDLAGFAAATYMRGIRFVNIPTTLLSMVDSSIGGKVAIDMDGVKNIAGAFYQPSRVLIDPDTLDTLDDRQLRAGLAEAIKMAATSDAALFEYLEALPAERMRASLETIIERSLRIKKAVVEQDPAEKGLRRVLNFGHTIGHAIESCQSGALLHGECVALGMLPMCSEPVRIRLEALLRRVGLPTRVRTTPDALAHFLSLDKKKSGAGIVTVYVEQIGSYQFRNMRVEDILAQLDPILQKGDA